VTASEIGTRPGLRRLQSSQTKRYDVAYEVLVPSSMDADALVAKMNRIAVPGSSESQAFRQVLTSTDGIARVGQIVAKIPAYKVEENATTPLGSEPEPLEEENSWTTLVIGTVAVFMALLCGTTTALMLKRKLQPLPNPVPSQKVDAEIQRGLDGVIVPGQEVDAEAGNGQQLDAKATYKTDDKTKYTVRPVDPKPLEEMSMAMSDKNMALASSVPPVNLVPGLQEDVPVEMGEI